LLQREAREKVRELSKRIGVNNAQRLAASPTAKPRPKEPSARQRAAEYAKASVPKPELLKQRSSVKQRGSSAPAAATVGSSGSQVGGELGSCFGLQHCLGCEAEHRWLGAAVILLQLLHAGMLLVACDQPKVWSLLDFCQHQIQTAVACHDHH
jgi:hypothetical protein